MKRILTNGFLILLLSVVCSVACDKDETIGDKPAHEQHTPDDGDEVPIPDGSFRACCIRDYDKNRDGIFSKYEASLVTQLHIPDRGIKSLEGIEYFTALERLECYSNELTELNVSGCVALEYLGCYSNELTELNVSGCVALERLDCYNNQLTELDVSKNTALEKLDCHSNKLTTLDVSGCAALGVLYCHNNQLTELDVSGCAELYTLSCHTNPLELLNLGDANPKQYLYEYLNGLHYYESYQSYPYFYNKLGSSTKFKIISSKITRLDVSINNLQSLDVSESPALETLDCSYNPLELLNLGDSNITVQNLQNRLLSSTTFKIISSKITKLNVINNNLQSLDVSECPALETLDCYNNPLELLNLGDVNPTGYYNPSVRYYQSYPDFYNKLGSSTKFKIISSKITRLVVSYNKLAALDVSECPALETLDCYNNQLTALDVSKTNLGNSTSSYPLDCAPMETLQTLYLKTGWSINCITQYRSETYIPSQTEIVYVD